MVVHAARNNLIDFQIATNINYKPNFHHEITAKELEHIAEVGDRDYKVVILCQPPRHGKSQQATIDFPAWYLGKYPDKEIITASYSSDLAQDFGTKTRDKVNSSQFKAIFNIGLKEDDKAKAKWRTSKGGSYTSVGVGGPITGRGANILIIDDPFKNREEAESEVIRKKVWDWFTSTAFTRLEPNGVVFLILTRWHTDDLAGRILDNEELRKRTKLIEFPAIALHNDEYRKQGDALWHTRFPINVLNEIKNAIGPYDWSALYQQKPVTSESQEFKNEWLRYIGEREVEMMNTRNFLTIDTAMSKKAQADFTGFCDNSVNREKFWHLRAWRVKLGAEELVDMLFTLYSKRRYEKIGIEKTAYLEGLKPYLDAEQRKRGVYLPIIELKHGGTAKEIRIRGLIPRYASGSIFHITGFCKDLEEELMTFPVGVHDDVIDATAYQSQLEIEESTEKLKQFRPKW